MLKDWLVGRKLYCAIGLGGVHPEESHQARKLARVFRYGLVIIAIALLFEWQMQVKGVQDERGWRVFNWVIWLFFATQFATLFLMIRKRGRFVRENWLLLVIIILGVPFLLNYTEVMVHIKPLRPLLAVLLMIPALGFLTRFLALRVFAWNL